MLKNRHKVTGYGRSLSIFCLIFVVVVVDNLYSLRCCRSCLLVLLASPLLFVAFLLWNSRHWWRKRYGRHLRGGCPHQQAIRCQETSGKRGNNTTTPSVIYLFKKKKIIWRETNKRNWQQWNSRKILVWKSIETIKDSFIFGIVFWFLFQNYLGRILKEH